MWNVSSPLQGINPNGHLYNWSLLLQGKGKSCSWPQLSTKPWSRILYLIKHYTMNKYEGVSKIFRTGRLERKLQMVQLSATRCTCIAIFWVSLVSFATVIFCVASQRVIPKVSIYFVIDSVRTFWIHPRILNLGVGWKWVVSFAPRPLLAAATHWIRRLSGLHPPPLLVYESKFILHVKKKNRYCRVLSD
jgi:hypothetical protein